MYAAPNFPASCTPRNINAIASARKGVFSYNDIAAYLLILSIPYSAYFLAPVNEKLEAKASSLELGSMAEVGLEREQTTHWLVDRWATLNLGRAVIVGMAGLVGTWAALGEARWAEGGWRGD